MDTYDCYCEETGNWDCPCFSDGDPSTGALISWADSSNQVLVLRLLHIPTCSSLGSSLMVINNNHHHCSSSSKCTMTSLVGWGSGSQPNWMAMVMQMHSQVESTKSYHNQTELLPLLLILLWLLLLLVWLLLLPTLTFTVTGTTTIYYYYWWHYYCYYCSYYYYYYHDYYYCSYPLPSTCLHGCCYC